MSLRAIDFDDAFTMRDRESFDALASRARLVMNPRERALASRPLACARVVDALVASYVDDAVRARALARAIDRIAIARNASSLAHCAMVFAREHATRCARARVAIARASAEARSKAMTCAVELRRHADANEWIARELERGTSEEAKKMAEWKRELSARERACAEGVDASIGNEARKTMRRRRGRASDDGDARTTVVVRTAISSEGEERSGGKRMRIRAPAPGSPTTSDDEGGERKGDGVATTRTRASEDVDAKAIGEGVGSRARDGESPSSTIETQPATDGESPDADVKLTSTSPTIKSVVRMLMDMDDPRTGAESCSIDGDSRDAAMACAT